MQKYYLTLDISTCVWTSSATMSCGRYLPPRLRSTYHLLRSSILGAIIQNEKWKEHARKLAISVSLA